MDYRTGTGIFGAEYNPFDVFGRRPQEGLGAQNVLAMHSGGSIPVNALARRSLGLLDYSMPPDLDLFRSGSNEPMPVQTFDRHYPSFDPHWQPPVNDTPYNPDPNQTYFYAGGRPRDAAMQAGSALWNLLGGPLSTYSAGPFNASVQYDPAIGKESFGARAGLSFRF